MATEIVRIKEIDAVESGTRQDGSIWSRRSFRGETLERYPRTINFTLDGSSIDRYPISTGIIVVVSYDVTSRSFTDREGRTRWSSDVRAYKIENVNSMAEQAPARTQQPQQQQMDQQAQAYFNQQPQPQYQQQYQQNPYQQR